MRGIKCRVYAIDASEELEAKRRTYRRTILEIESAAVAAVAARYLSKA